MHEIRKELNKWRDRYSMFMDMKTNIVKMPVLAKLTLQMQCNPQLPASYFMDIYKVILRFIQRGKRPRIANTILKKKNKFGGLTLPNFRTYYKATIINTVCYW